MSEKNKTNNTPSTNFTRGVNIPPPKERPPMPKVKPPKKEK